MHLRAGQGEGTTVHRRRAWAFVAAAVTIASVAVTGQGTAVAERPSPPFTWRGVVAAHYGPPASHTDRLALLRWMGAHDLNVFVFAYKNDLYQRYWWRDPYPASQRAEMLDEVRVARDHGVEWVPNLTVGIPLLADTPIDAKPGSDDVCFSCPGDLATILAKYDPFFEAGVRTFMLSFDDVVKVSSHPEDAAAYGAGDEAFGRMNRDLLNAVHDHYAARAGDEPFTLLTVLADYSATSDTPYLAGIRADGGLHDGIEVAWTGPAVFSPTVQPGDARAYAALVGRERVLLWDNYPVNDLTGGGVGVDPRDRNQWIDDTRLFLGPYQGRAPDLASGVVGVIANPMRQLWASRVALATMAEYLGDPAGYEPEHAWSDALAGLGGRDSALADAIAALAENSRSSPLNHAESPIYTAATQELLEALDAGAFWRDAASRLVAELHREESSPPVIRSRFPELAADTDPFLAALAGNAAASRTAVDLLAAQRPHLTVNASRSGPHTVHVTGRAMPPSAFEVNTLLARLDVAFANRLADPHFVHGTRAGSDLSTVYAAENRFDAFVLEVQRRTHAWLSTAALAARGVTVRVNGVVVSLDESGGFAVDVPAAAGLAVVATDGAGGSTGQRS